MPTCRPHHLSAYVPGAKLARFSSPAVDLVGLAALLQAPAIGNFDRVEKAGNLPLLELRWQVADFYRRKRRHDELLLYFTGYGFLDASGQLYQATADTRSPSL